MLRSGKVTSSVSNISMEHNLNKNKHPIDILITFSLDHYGVEESFRL